MLEPHIEIQNLNIYYGERQAMKNITLNIPKKRITAIIGPSGCGKSTLLKSMNRLIELSDGVKVTGKILVDRVDVYEKGTDVTEIRKKMGLIAQTPNPLPMSIYENVVYGPQIHGMKDRKELDQTVYNCLEAAGLWSEVKDRLKEPASRLSVGQQQRLCLARALAIKPEVLLCDEATSSLDPISARSIEQQLLNLKKDYTIVFVTHILRQARRLADYVVFLYLGELIEHGPAEGFFAHPSNVKTKEYIQGVFG